MITLRADFPMQAFSREFGSGKQSGLAEAALAAAA